MKKFIDKIVFKLRVFIVEIKNKWSKK